MAFVIKEPPEFTTGVTQWTRETLADGAEMSKVPETLLNNEIYLKRVTERAAHITSVALPAADWSAEAPYIQTVSVEGLTAEDNPMLVRTLPDGATPGTVKAYNKAFGMIDHGDTAKGTAVFKCYNKKPTIDLIVGLKGV